LQAADHLTVVAYALCLGEGLGVGICPAPSQPFGDLPYAASGRRGRPTPGGSPSHSARGWSPWTRAASASTLGTQAATSVTWSPSAQITIAGTAQPWKVFASLDGTSPATLIFRLPSNIAVVAIDPQ
jgi:hypothetical protein